MKAIIKFSLTFLCLVFIIVSCEKDINSGRMIVKMTCSNDSVPAYEHVYVDIKQVSINYLGSKQDSWIDLSTDAGIYDLLELMNDVTIALTDEEKLPIGKVGQIRLLLGNNNTVVVAGTAFPLKVPSAYTSGVKIVVNQEIRRTQKIIITLDFDAEQSINQDNGDFIMNPVIKVKSISYY